MTRRPWQPWGRGLLTGVVRTVPQLREALAAGGRVEHRGGGERIIVMPDETTVATRLPADGSDAVVAVMQRTTDDRRRAEDPTASLIALVAGS